MEIQEILRQVFDSSTVDDELWGELDSMDEGTRINVPITVADLKAIRSFIVGNDNAICVCCGQLKPVCCDSRTITHENGTVEHIDPRCPECCTHEPQVAWDGMNSAGGTYEVNGGV